MIKRLLLLPTTLGPVRRLTRTFLRAHAIIFMAHRFARPGDPESGHDPTQLAIALSKMRGDGTKIVPVWDLIQRGTKGEDVSGMVAFTVDDGYSDFFEIAAPIFQAYECPVTLFPVTGFLDGDSWMWWDKVRFAVTRSDRASFEMETGGKESTFPLKSPGARIRAVRVLRRELAKMSLTDRVKAQTRLESELGVPVPEAPPKEFAPMTWDQVRELASKGVTFGPHTVDHPNLATLLPPEAELQIRQSWERLKSETEAAIPVFCFPYGTAWSLSPALADYLRQAGLEAAVTAEEGHVSVEGLRRNPFDLPRMGWPDTSMEALNISSGLARLKEVVVRRR